jgi:hypothetical protein
MRRYFEFLTLTFENGKTGKGWCVFMGTANLSVQKRFLVFLTVTIILFGGMLFGALTAQAIDYDFDDGFGGQIDPNPYNGITIGPDDDRWQWFATFNACLHTSITLEPKRYHIIGGSSMSIIKPLGQPITGTFSFDPAVVGTVRGVALSYSSGGTVTMQAYSAAGALLAQASGPANLGTDRMNRLALNAATPISYVVVSGTPTETCPNSGTSGRIVLDNLETSATGNLRPGYQLNSFQQDITFPGGAGIVTPYPIPITVTNIPGVITEVEAGITNFTHTSPGELDFLLAAPSATGRKTLLMSDVGGNNAFNNINLLFSSSATQTLPANGLINGGRYQPTNNNPGGDTDIFAPPAPTSPYSATMTVFNGINPNGVWNLFGWDDTASGGNGDIIRGWYLTFYTCTALSVTKNNDDNSCGTLRYAVNYLNDPANTSQRTTAITFSGVTNITLSSGITLANGVKIQGDCTTGPGVIINGNNSTGVGVRLLGNNTLTGLWIRGFNGAQLQATSGRSFMKCVRASRN